MDVGETRGIVVSGHETRAAKTTALMDKHMTTLVVSIISNHDSSYVRPLVRKICVDRQQSQV
jgi:hypothetical protein